MGPETTTQINDQNVHHKRCVVCELECYNLHYDCSGVEPTVASEEFACRWFLR